MHDQINDAGLRKKNLYLIQQARQRYQESVLVSPQLNKLHLAAQPYLLISYRLSAYGWSSTITERDIKMLNWASLM